MTGIIIQARVSSARYPGKVMQPFYNGKCILELLLEKLKNESLDLPVIVATTTSPADDDLVELCKKRDTPYFRGDELNVLDRMINCAQHFKIKNIIRICCDNPFILTCEIKKLIRIGQSNKYDYVSFMTSKNQPSILTHYGLWAEFVKVQSLQKASRLTQNPKHLEHVTNYIYLTPEKFKLHFIKIPLAIEKMTNLRLTIDTKEDFNVLKNIYNKIPNPKSWKEIYFAVKSNLKWLEIMESQILTNSK